MSMNLNPINYPVTDGPDVGVIPVGDGTPTTTVPVAPGTPEWWLERLLARLAKQMSYCQDHWRYYEGDQPLAFASKKFNEAYGTRYNDLPANFMPLVIEAEKERLVVQGFRFGSAVPTDKSVWGIWQDNNLDSESMLAHEIVLAKGSAYTMVEQYDGKPLITVEDPAQVTLETAPGNRRIRLAALKAWKADDGYLRAYLYLPTEIYKWRSRSKSKLSVSGNIAKASAWQPELPNDEDFPIRNVLGVVPVVPLLNRPTLEGHGRSELVPIIGNQNAINFLRFSALIGSDTAALPQRWAKNLDIEVDSDTGQVKIPFRPGASIWASRKPTPEEQAEYGDKYPEAEFGQFPAADLRPFVNMIQQEISMMSAISRTPYHYLLGMPQSVPPTGESIKSSEAPLVKKVVAASIHLGEGWEETMRVALIAAGQTAKARNTQAETIWADPETRNEATHNQAIMLQWTSGLIPDDFALEELGYSAQQIARIHAMKAAQPTPPPTDEPPTEEGSFSGE